VKQEFNLVKSWQKNIPEGGKGYLVSPEASFLKLP
jgi:hypothetical protein